jgi:hypothetical protein
MPSCILFGLNKKALLKAEVNLTGTSLEVNWDAKRIHYEQQSVLCG